MKQPILSVRDLHYVYGNGQAGLDGVNIDINEGEKISRDRFQRSWKIDIFFVM